MKEVLIEKARIDLGDYFEFLVSGPKMELDGAPYGGARFQVDALIDGKRFAIFDLDIGIGDVWIEPHDNLRLKNYLDFAGFESPEIEVRRVEQHFAEKIHAYTVPRMSQICQIQWRELRVNLAELAKLRWIDGRSRKELAKRYGRIEEAVQNYFQKIKK